MAKPKTDFWTSYMMQYMSRDPERRFQPEASKPRTREKKIVNDGKGVKRREAVKGIAPVRGEERTDTRAKLHGYFRNWQKLAEQHPEAAKKATEQARKRDNQNARGILNSVYRENYMPAESYAKYQDALYGKKKRR